MSPESWLVSFAPPVLPWESVTLRVGSSGFGIAYKLF